MELNKPFILKRETNNTRNTDEIITERKKCAMWENKAGFCRTESGLG